MSALIGHESKEIGDNQILVKIFFRTKDDPRKKGKRCVELNDQGQAYCLRCQDWYADNSGHGNLYNHIIRNHDDWQVLLF